MFIPFIPSNKVEIKFQNNEKNNKDAVYFSKSQVNIRQEILASARNWDFFFSYELYHVIFLI